MTIFYILDQNEIKEESRIAGPVLSKPAYENSRNSIDSSKMKLHIVEILTNYKWGLIRSQIGVAILANKLYYFSENTPEKIFEMARLSLLNRMAAYY